MRRVGFIMAYNEVDWIAYAIDQAIKLCDMVIICEGSQFSSFPHISERSDDGTLAIIESKQREYPGIIVLVNTARKYGNYRDNQCANFNHALSMCNIGDYFIPLDVDEFYKDIFIDEINELMYDGKVDYLNACGYLYGFGFNWRVHFNASGVWTKDVLFKNVNGFHFVPSHQPRGFGKHVIVNKEDNIFHYSWVKPSTRMRIRMETSGFYPGMLQWFDTHWETIELVDGKKQRSHKGSDFFLSKYNGEHPSVLQEHPWRYLEDIRKVK